ncbi:unnamed protein product [Amoebophrya sp. A25]|nr:unnamed protein product [Amoebophrya sp. A25]|eukprot:GSA25T00008584001.1
MPTTPKNCRVIAAVPDSEMPTSRIETLNLKTRGGALHQKGSNSEAKGPPRHPSVLRLTASTSSCGGANEWSEQELSTTAGAEEDPGAESLSCGGGRVLPVQVQQHGPRVHWGGEQLPEDSDSTGFFEQQERRAEMSRNVSLPMDRVLRLLEYETQRLEIREGVPDVSSMEKLLCRYVSYEVEDYGGQQEHFVEDGPSTDLADVDMLTEEFVEQQNNDLEANLLGEVMRELLRQRRLRDKEEAAREQQKEQMKMPVAESKNKTLQTPVSKANAAKGSTSNQHAQENKKASKKGCNVILSRLLPSLLRLYDVTAILTHHAADSDHKIAMLQLRLLLRSVILQRLLPKQPRAKDVIRQLETEILEQSGPPQKSGRKGKNNTLVERQEEARLKHQNIMNEAGGFSSTTDIFSSSRHAEQDDFDGSKDSLAGGDNITQQEDVLSNRVWLSNDPNLELDVSKTTGSRMKKNIKNEHPRRGPGTHGGLTADALARLDAATDINNKNKGIFTEDERKKHKQNERDVCKRLVRIRYETWETRGLIAEALVREIRVLAPNRMRARIVCNSLPHISRLFADAPIEFQLQYLSKPAFLLAKFMLQEQDLLEQREDHEEQNEDLLPASLLLDAVNTFVFGLLERVIAADNVVTPFAKELQLESVNLPTRVTSLGLPTGCQSTTATPQPELLLLLRNYKQLKRASHAISVRWVDFLRRCLDQICRAAAMLPFANSPTIASRRTTQAGSELEASPLGLASFVYLAECHSATLLYHPNSTAPQQSAMLMQQNNNLYVGTSQGKRDPLEQAREDEEVGNRPYFFWEDADSSDSCAADEDQDIILDGQQEEQELHLQQHEHRTTRSRTSSTTTNSKISDTDRHAVADLNTFLVPEVKFHVSTNRNGGVALLKDQTIEVDHVMRVNDNNKNQDVNAKNYTHITSESTMRATTTASTSSTRHRQSCNLLSSQKSVVLRPSTSRNTKNFSYSHYLPRVFSLRVRLNLLQDTLDTLLVNQKYACAFHLFDSVLVPAAYELWRKETEQIVLTEEAKQMSCGAGGGSISRSTTSTTTSSDVLLVANKQPLALSLDAAANVNVAAHYNSCVHRMMKKQEKLAELLLPPRLYLELLTALSSAHQAEDESVSRRKLQDALAARRGKKKTQGQDTNNQGRAVVQNQNQKNEPSLQGAPPAAASSIRDTLLRHVGVHHAQILDSTSRTALYRRMEEMLALFTLPPNRRSSCTGSFDVVNKGEGGPRGSCPTSAVGGASPGSASPAHTSPGAVGGASPGSTSPAHNKSGVIMKEDKKATRARRIATIGVAETLRFDKYYDHVIRAHMAASTAADGVSPEQRQQSSSLYPGGVPLVVLLPLMASVKSDVWNSVLALEKEKQYVDQIAEEEANANNSNSQQQENDRGGRHLHEWKQSLEAAKRRVRKLTEKAMKKVFDEIAVSLTVQDAHELLGYALNLARLLCSRRAVTAVGFLDKQAAGDYLQSAFLTDLEKYCSNIATKLDLEKSMAAQNSHANVFQHLEKTSFLLTDVRNAIKKAASWTHQ